MKVNKLLRKKRRKRRIGSKIKGSHDRPRISVFRSNYYIYAQAIDDENRQTIAQYSSLLSKKSKKTTDQKKTKTEQAKEVGQVLAGILKKKKITRAVFDRGSYAYKGRVKALAEGLRKGGLKI